MANTATVYARIEPNLGVTLSSLIQMLYSQIKLTNSIPFEIKMPFQNTEIKSFKTPKQKVSKHRKLFDL